jgi:hypothetical protein
VPLAWAFLGGGTGDEIPQPIPALLVALVVAVRGACRSLRPARVVMRRPPRPRFGEPDRANERRNADDETDDASRNLALEQAYHAEHEIDGEDGDRRPPGHRADTAGQEAGSADERSGHHQYAEDGVD